MHAETARAMTAPTNAATAQTTRLSPPETTFGLPWRVFIYLQSQVH
jgi:hypothetical protein